MSRVTLVYGIWAVAFVAFLPRIATCQLAVQQANTPTDVQVWQGKLDTPTATLRIRIDSN